MTELAQVIKTAMQTSRGCCHEPIGKTCVSCMSQHIADVVIHSLENK
jgi:hypothetical protein